MYMASNIVDLINNSDEDESSNESDLSNAMDADMELADPESEQSIEQSTSQFSQSSTGSIQSNDTRQRAISQLDRLRPPRKSDLDRKRKTVTNPPRGKCKCKSTFFWVVINCNYKASTKTFRVQG